MTEPTQLVQFPAPSTSTLLLLALGFMFMLFAAVGFEFYRRMQRIRVRREQQWRNIRQIFREREVSPEITGQLEEIVARHSQDAPLHAVTTREGFEKCMDAEMSRIRHTDDFHVLEETGLRLRDARTDLGLDYVPPGQRIHSTRELHDGQLLSIARSDATKPQWLRAMIEDVNEAFFYVVLKDVATSAAPNINPGDKIRCRLWRDEDARYLFEATVAAYNAPPPTWRLEHTHLLQRTQARAHFRVRHDQSVTIDVLELPAEGKEVNLRARKPVARLRGRVTSLSAGGCAVVLKQDVARQVLLRIALDIPGIMQVDLIAEIVATAPISGGRYLVRTRFLELDEETRDVIARHVMHKQQQRLADGEPVE